jgi:hypothetical protein
MRADCGVVRVVSCAMHMSPPGCSTTSTGGGGVPVFGAAVCASMLFLFLKELCVCNRESELVTRCATQQRRGFGFVFARNTLARWPPTSCAFPRHSQSDTHAAIRVCRAHYVHTSTLTTIAVLCELTPCVRRSHIVRAAWASAAFAPRHCFWMICLHRGVWVDRGHAAKKGRAQGKYAHNMFNARRASQQTCARAARPNFGGVSARPPQHTLNTYTPQHRSLLHIYLQNPRANQIVLPTSLAYTALLWDAYTHRKSGGLTFLTGFCFFVLASNTGRRAPPHLAYLAYIF